MGLLLKMIGLLLRKVGGALLAGLVAWGAAAAWLQSEDQGDFALRQKVRLETLAAKSGEIAAELTRIEQRRKIISVEMSAQETRANQAARVITTLHDLESMWDRYVSNPEQQKSNSEQIARMEAMRAQAQVQIDELNNEIKRQVWQRSALELDQAKLREQIDFAQQHNSPLAYYPYQAWSRFRWVILGAVVLYALVVWSWGINKFWRSVPENR